MTKADFLKVVASHGYDIYFGAKRHLATYDIIEKFPKSIALIGVCIGVVQLWKPNLPHNDLISVGLVLISILAYTITQYDAEKEKYNNVGKELIRLYKELKALYYKAKGDQNFNYEHYELELNRILDEYSNLGISKQIFFSNTRAHITFFGESQIEWMNEQLEFKLWKDKIPGVYKILIYLFSILIALLIVGGLVKLLIDYLI
ncbi:SLATT domain-containing protein [Paenibacillus kandeliae]|uniref:SLATT domain-containing protein n=1 Tax=Paenibacillus kandeliae TaxID=3231269 RepID=UPI003458EAA2